MSLFGFGASKSKSSSFGQSSSYNQATSGGVSGGFSTGGSAASQSVAFEDVFARLFGGAEGAAAGLDPSMLSSAADQLFSGGVDFLSQLSGGEGRDYLADRMSGESPLLDEQIAALEQDTGRFFNETLLPGIQGDAIAAGGLGGGRQGVAEGLAAERTADAFTQGVTALRTADMNARDQAARDLVGTDLAGAQAGLAGLPSLYGLANESFGAELEPFNRLAAILGGPTVLGESSSFSDAENFARQFAESFGSSQATQRSSGESMGFSFRPFT